MENNVKPVHATCYFTVSRNGEFNQILIYDYYDPEGYYAKLLHKPRALRNDLLNITLNMQEFLNEEIIKINNIVAKPKIVNTQLIHRGFKDSPSIAFTIKFKGNLSRGINVFENLSNEEETPYDFETTWIFPLRSRVLETLLRGYVNTYKNIVIINARRGEIVGGYEKIVFRI
ncbi:MAG: hypothetical protein QXY40_09930 [Candidatus Methanomethylicia archaeon]